MRTLLLAVFALSLLGCPREPVIPIGGGCNESCDHAREMKCALGNPTPRGNTCEATCAKNDDNGMPWPVACLRASKTCSELEACRND